MKSLLTANLLMFFLLSCNQESGRVKEQTMQSSDAKELQKTDDTDEDKEGSFPFEIIRKSSVKRKTSVNLEALVRDNSSKNTLKAVDQSFFKKWLQSVKVAEINSTLRYEKSLEMEGMADIFKDPYHFYDYAETEELFLFSILGYVQDAYEFRLYHFTCDKKSGVLKRIDWIATTGGEGGIGFESAVNYSKGGTVALVTQDMYELIDVSTEHTIYKEQYTFEQAKTIKKQLSKTTRIEKNEQPN